MSRAKALIERMCPMPVITPEPGTKPKTAPSPSRTAPAREKPNPFRRGKVRPGEEPRPKARHEGMTAQSLAKSLIEDSDFVEKMRAAREAKKNGGKAPEGKEGKGEGDDKGAKKPAKSGGGTPKSGEAVQHAFKK